jgi:membrane protease YdiL (CAAX protease family)
VAGQKVGRWLAGPGGLRPLWGLPVFALTVAALVYVFFFAAPFGPPPPFDASRDVQVFWGEGKLLLVVLASTAVMAAIERRNFWSYGLGGPRALRRFWWGGVWGVALMSALAGCLIAARQVIVEGSLLSSGDVPTYAASYAAAFLIAAVAEEALYRGYAQTALARLAGFWPAAIVLSLIFGLVHLNNAGGSFVAVANAVVAGIVLSLCLRLSGSLWWGIGFHGAWNWTQSFVFGTPASGYLIETPLLQSQTVGNPTWSGGLSGPEGSVLAAPILCIAAAIIVATFRRTAASTESI